jgi:hypothetical protein
MGAMGELVAQPPIPPGAMGELVAQPPIPPKETHNLMSLSRV